jgi:hypothetical protein
LARELRERNISVVRMAFADPIKDIALHLLGMPKTVSYGTQADKENYKYYGKSARHWLQWIGTEVARNQVHPDTWIHRFVDRAVCSDAQVITGSDCRFRNEIEVMREQLAGKMDLMVFKIINPRIPVNLQHQSESEVYHLPEDLFTGVIHNTSGLSELMTKIVDVADGVTNVLSCRP